MKKVWNVAKHVFMVCGLLEIAYELICLIMAKISPKTYGRIMTYVGSCRLKAQGLYDDLYDDNSDFAKGCEEAENLFY